LLALGLIDAPLVIMNTAWRCRSPRLCLSALHGAADLPSLVKLDSALLEAAANLGLPATTRAFGWLRSLGAVRESSPAACLVFVPMVGEVVVPDLLGVPTH